MVAGGFSILRKGMMMVDIGEEQLKLTVNRDEYQRMDKQKVSLGVRVESIVSVT